MKILYSFVLFTFALTTLYAQEEIEAVNGWDLQQKVDRSTAKELRKDRLAKDLEWEDKYFNTPKGKWYIGFRAGYSWPWSTIRQLSPLSFIGTSYKVINADGTKSDAGIYSSDGVGPRLAVEVGHMFNQYMGIELI